MNIGALIAGPLGPYIVIPAVIWGFLAVLALFVAFADFRRTRSYDNARFLRWTLLAIVCTPLASIVILIGGVGMLGYLIFTKAGWLWNNSVGLIWDALWMKETESDVDAHSI